MCSNNGEKYVKDHVTACKAANDTVIGYCDPKQDDRQCCGSSSCTACNSYGSCDVATTTTPVITSTTDSTTMGTTTADTTTTTTTEATTLGGTTTITTIGDTTVATSLPTDGNPTSETATKLTTDPVTTPESPTTTLGVTTTIVTDTTTITSTDGSIPTPATATKLLITDPEASADSLPLIIGVVFGSIVFCGAILGVVYYVVNRSKKLSAAPSHDDVALSSVRDVSPVESAQTNNTNSNEYGRVDVVDPNYSSRLSPQAQQQQQAGHYAPIEAPRKQSQQYASTLSAQAKHAQANHYEDVGQL
eukprot:TRINITY_DN724_c0_g1_i4.p1 TRINITY_DN724_c0_g1~~TRINITY_DN724_c0_g1_i4.p1  ORF type:complete len:304 (-),score=5.02 TRINITY_DN724_c0_g1_i4:50-961(-)